MPQILHFPDAVPTLFGDKVYLRELTKDDVPAWFERASDPESAVLAVDPIPESVEMGFQWLQRHMVDYTFSSLIVSTMLSLRIIAPEIIMVAKTIARTPAMQATIAPQ